MKLGNTVIVFFIEGYRYGIALDLVERVAPICEVTPIPDAPDTVIGIINVRGNVMPVLNLRTKLKITERPLKLSDQLLICHFPKGTMAILVDAIEGSIEFEDADVTTADSDSGKRVLKTPEGIVFIYDYNELLNSKEQSMLGNALAKVSA